VVAYDPGIAKRVRSNSSAASEANGRRAQAQTAGGRPETALEEPQTRSAPRPH
jgi:hypothetical protein